MRLSSTPVRSRSGAMHPRRRRLLKYRYPYKDEIAEAKLFVARALNRRAGIEEE
jgi:hypothetical protein